MPRGCSAAEVSGTVDHFGLHGRVDIQVGTLSKAIGVIGGFIAGPAHLIEWLQNRGRPYLFSTSAPPAVTAACIAALDVLRDEPERLERLWANTATFKEGLALLGFDTGTSQTPITPVITGEADVTQRFADRLFEEGVFCPAIVFPTVAKDSARVRTIVTADHTDADLAEALEIFGRVGRELGLRLSASGSARRVRCVSGSLRASGRARIRTARPRRIRRGREAAAASRAAVKGGGARRPSSRMCGGRSLAADRRTSRRPPSSPRP